MDKIFTMSFWLMTSSLLVLTATQTVREYNMDEFATCGRTLNIDDSGIRLIGRGNTAPSNPPTECIVYLQSVYARDDGSNKLQVKVEALNIKDCNVKVDLFNGRTSVGQTLQALSCQYSSTGLVYSTGREVTVKFSRPDRIVFNDYQFTLEIKPFKDSTTAAYTTHLTNEQATTPPATTHVLLRKDLECLDNSYLKVFIPVSIAPNSELSLKDPTCRLINNGTHHVTSVYYSSCGNTLTQYNGYTTVENEITVHVLLNDTSLIEFVQDYTIPLKCFLYNTSVHTGFQVSTRENISEIGDMLGNIEIKEYRDEQFQEEITEYPFTVPINRQIFVQVAFVNTQRYDVDVRAQSCDATPSASPNDPTRVILITEGCSANPAVKILRRRAGGGFRFSMQTFHFTSNVNENNMVYIHCRVIPCFFPSCDTICHNSRRRKRRSRQLPSVTLTSGAHVVTADYS